MIAKSVSIRALRSFVKSMFLLVPIAAASPAMGNGENELLSKHDWSVLQSVEYRYREVATDEHVLIVEQWGKHLVGVLSTQGDQRLWILLDPNNKPFVKQLPNGEYRISALEYKRILAFGNIHPEVRTALSNAVQAEPATK